MKKCGVCSYRGYSVKEREGRKINVARKGQEEERSRAKEGRCSGRGVRGTKGGGTQVKRPSAWQAARLARVRLSRSSSRQTRPGPGPCRGPEPSLSQPMRVTASVRGFFRYRDPAQPLESFFFPFSNGKRSAIPNVSR